MSESKKHGRVFKKMGVLITVFMVSILVAGCSTGFIPQGEDDATVTSSLAPTAKGPTNGLVQSSTGSTVTIDIEWLRPDDDLLIFAVALNTHSVDLDHYDLGELATLRDDEGEEYHPTSWDSAPGGHHRQGTLTFPFPYSLSQEKAKYIQIVIRDVDDIDERLFKWEL